MLYPVPRLTRRRSAAKRNTHNTPRRNLAAGRTVLYVISERRQDAPNKSK
nr:MAG TPA: hypothetical protein [Caudoviricetes sp.]